MTEADLYKETMHRRGSKTRMGIIVDQEFFPKVLGGFNTKLRLCTFESWPVLDSAKEGMETHWATLTLRLRLDQTSDKIVSVASDCSVEELRQFQDLADLQTL